MHSTLIKASTLIGAALLVPIVSAPAQAVQPTATTYTLAQVAKHNKASDCWAVVNRNVYNLTGWAAKHPGGKRVITAMCGKDATASFNAAHKGAAKPATYLKKFKVGVLG